MPLCRPRLIVVIDDDDSRPDILGKSEQLGYQVSYRLLLIVAVSDFKQVPQIVDNYQIGAVFGRYRR